MGEHHLDELVSAIQNLAAVDKIEVVMMNTDFYNKLFEEFKVEFETEYVDIGRDPNLDDMTEYLGVKIVVADVDSYKLLREVE